MCHHCEDERDYSDYYVMEDFTSNYSSSDLRNASSVPSVHHVFTTLEIPHATCLAPVEGYSFGSSALISGGWVKFLRLNQFGIMRSHTKFQLKQT